VISNQRPNSTTEFTHTKASRKSTIHFDKDGVCDACRVAEQKSTTIDWDERGAQTGVNFCEPLSPQRRPL